MTATSAMTHLLITRFNLNYGDIYPYSEVWMQHRMALFARFCQPSVRRQTATDFRWLVYFDRARTQAHQARLAPLFDDPRFEAVHVDSPDAMIADIRARAPRSGAFLTSRLDNDDVLHPDFVTRLQMRAAELVADGALPVAIDAPLLTWWHEGGTRAQRFRSDVVSPFASVLEAAGPEGWAAGPWGAGPRTVFIARHENLRARLGRVVDLPEPLSLTVLHGRNVSNGQGRFGVLGRLLRRWRARDSYMSGAQTAQMLTDFGLADAGFADACAAGQGVAGQARAESVRAAAMASFDPDRKG